MKLPRGRMAVLQKKQWGLVLGALAAAFAVFSLAVLVPDASGVDVGLELEGRGRRHRMTLKADIAQLDKKLGIAEPYVAAIAKIHAKRITAKAVKAHHQHRIVMSTDKARSQSLSPKDALSTAMKLWRYPKLSGPWEAKDQDKYDRAVHHAQIVEREGVEVYHPLSRMSHTYSEDANGDNERFEDQLAHLITLLEPSYLAEAIGWAHSGDTNDNQLLRPVALALEKPLVTELDREARARVVTAVDALAKKDHLSLVQREQLRAHLIAPLLMRIHQRVHKQVAHYVVKLARAVVLKAANTTEAGGQGKVGLFNGIPQVFPTVPKLNDADLKFVNALHDLHGIYKSKVVDKEGYEVQRAKLLSDWLKYAVNEAGGNARYVLKIMFGGNVRGVTDTGIRHPSKISVHRKLALEKGIASLGKDRAKRMTRDLIYQLVHGEGQWGDLQGCDEAFSSPKCHDEWKKIRHLVDAYVRDDDTELEWGHSPDQGVLSGGTKALLHHFDQVAKGKGKNGVPQHPLTGLATAEDSKGGATGLMPALPLMFVTACATASIAMWWL